MNRLGLFLFFDGEGIVDDYVRYLLEDMNRNLTHLCILVNGELKSEGRKILETFTDHIIVRSNHGFDVGAWKDAMIDEFGFDKLAEYDEVILFNDSFFGPVYPFKEMFDEMDGRDLDFWAITVHGDAPDPRNLCPYPYRPRYLQLFFLVFTKRFVQSKEFQDYWRELPYFENFNDVGYKHQAVFTKHFEDLGFKWAAYVDTGDLEESVDKSISFHTYNMYDMVANRRLPVIKRKAFKLPLKFHMIYNSGMELASTMQYIKDNTDYDVSLIYKYFLRTMGPCELATMLNLKRIIPKDNAGDYQSDKRIAAIVQINNTDTVQWMSYLENIPDYIDVIVITGDNAKKGFIEENCLSKLNNDYQILTANHRISSLFIACRDIIDDYDYFCVVNDGEPDVDDFLTVRTSYMNSLWENTLASEDYINSIVKAFDEDDNLGLVVAPMSYYGNYFSDFADRYWDSSFTEVEELFNRMNLHTQLSDEEPPLSMGNCFWARTDALKPLLDLDSINEYDDHVLERIYPYVAAGQRYYTMTAMTSEYGQNELTNYQYMFEQTANVIGKKTEGRVNSKRTFNVFISTLHKGLIDLTKYKQYKTGKIMQESSLWKTSKPFRKMFFHFKK